MPCGMVVSLLFPGIVSGIDPTVNPVIWEVSAELVVIVVRSRRGLKDRHLGGLPALFADDEAARHHHARSPSRPSPFSAEHRGDDRGRRHPPWTVLATTESGAGWGSSRSAPRFEGQRKHPVRFAHDHRAGLKRRAGVPLCLTSRSMSPPRARTLLSGVQSGFAWDVSSLSHLGRDPWLRHPQSAGRLGRISSSVPAWNSASRHGSRCFSPWPASSSPTVGGACRRIRLHPPSSRGWPCRRFEARHRFHQQLHAFANSIEHANHRDPPSSSSAASCRRSGRISTGASPHPALGLILVIRPSAGMLGLLGKPVEAEGARGSWHFLRSAGDRSLY